MNSKLIVPLSIAGAVIAALVIVSPWAGKKDGGEGDSPDVQWFKGNTHTHSLWSDGNDFPDMIVAWYKEQGYDFLSLSDHNVLSRGERWMKLATAEKRRKKPGAPIIEKYREKLGAEWVETRGEGEALEVRLKNLEELRPRFEEEDKFLLIEGEEITDRFGKQQVHINAINLATAIQPQHGASALETIRNNIRAVNEQAESLERPIIAHINHPNFQWSLNAEELAEAVEARFFEVYNGHPGINHNGDGTRPGDEKLWDLANAMRVGVLQVPPLFGVATDDSHYYHGGNVSPGRGWVMVRAAKLEENLLLEAMQRGDFYSSSGVVLEDLSFQKGVLRLRIAPVDGVTFSTSFIGTRKGDGAEAGEVFRSVVGLAPSYELKGDEHYVRAVVSSSRAHPNPSFDAQVEQAWTQPVGW